MSEQNNKIKLFKQKAIRTAWDEEQQEWYFSVIDVVGVLSDSANPTDYLKKMRKRDELLASYIGTNCPQVEMKGETGKTRKVLAANGEQLLRIIQSIPSPKAEPFKLWLAKVGSERLDETVDPELSIDRAIQNYRRLGYSENWINQRIKSIEVRKVLTDEWDKSGVARGEEYAALTDLMSRTWSGMNTREYKKHKGLKKENLRDNMTNTELVLNMLAEVATTDISVERQPVGFTQSAEVAKEGASVAKTAREQLETRTGKPAVSKLNAKNLGQISLGEVADKKEGEDTANAAAKIIKRGTDIIAVALDDGANGGYACYDTLKDIYPSVVSCTELKHLTGQLLGIISKHLH
ncbi:phage antirepressor [Clostridia bacterium]|nr:phage antirepressor [Clostridia bacterium]